MGRSSTAKNRRLRDAVRKVARLRLRNSAVSVGAGFLFESMGVIL